MTDYCFCGCHGLKYHKTTCGLCNDKCILRYYPLDKSEISTRSLIAILAGMFPIVIVTVALGTYFNSGLFGFIPLAYAICIILLIDKIRESNN